MNFISLKVLYKSIVDAWDNRDRNIAYVITGMTPSATGAGTLGVTVALGKCAYGPYPGTFLNYAGGAITLTAASASNARVDLVIINSAGTLAKVDGTVAAVGAISIAPALPANACLLAVCFVPTSATDFTAAGAYVEDMTTVKRSPMTTKGDLLTTDGNIDQRVGVGTNTQVLTADSAQALGVKWATPSAAASGGTPAVVLGTANAAGVATTFLRDDDTILTFDATVPAAVGTAAAGAATTAPRRDHVHATGAGTPTTIAFSDVAATGTGPAAAMTDHKHGMAASPTSGMTLISDVLLGSATPTLNLASIAATYKHLLIYIQARGDNGGTNEAWNLTLNGDVGANYDWETIQAQNVTATAGNGLNVALIRISSAAGPNGAPAGYASSAVIKIPNYAGTTFNKNVISECASTWANAANGLLFEGVMGHWKSTAAVNRVTLTPGTSANFLTGSRMTVYGLA